MDFEYFGSLTAAEAQEFLDHYLEIEREVTCAQLPSMAADGVRVDFSVASVPGFLKWTAPRLRIVSNEQTSGSTRARGREEDESVELEEESKNLVLRASYYMGEAFVREHRNLSWGLGNSAMPLHNMPVVRGFAHGKELPPIWVTEDLFQRILEGDAPVEEIDTTIAYWRGMAP